MLPETPKASLAALDGVPGHGKLRLDSGDGGWTETSVVKSPARLQRQMAQRGWTATQIEEARASGTGYKTVNLETGGSATRYVHPVTGRSVIIDDETGGVLHVGGDGLGYRDGLRSPP